MKKFFGAMALILLAGMLMTVGAMETETLDVIPGAILLAAGLIGFGVSLKLSGAMIKR